MVAALAACQPSTGSGAPLGQSAAGLEQVPLTITSNSKVHRFTVEVAASEEQQMTGLMNRPALARDRGMIFPFPQPRIASFWMKNTLIPLDIIFVRTDGTIANVAANAIPLSLEAVSSDGEVGSVLEINGGQAAELGIGPGDKVEWPD
nr:DUF192 domain-containing protein [uncultured Sphingomonas sp.]